MKWYNSFEYKPKKSSLIWVWNINKQKQELFLVNSNAEIDWDPHKLYEYPIWSYVFELDSLYQPERLNPETSKKKHRGPYVDPETTIVPLGRCDSLNSAVMSRGRSEEVSPPCKWS